MIVNHQFACNSTTSLWELVVEPFPCRLGRIVHSGLPSGLLIDLLQSLLAPYTHGVIAWIWQLYYILHYRIGTRAAVEALDRVKV